MKLLTMINRSPWNEVILLEGDRVKTGGNIIKHRGLILLYTSKTKPTEEEMEALASVIGYIPPPFTISRSGRRLPPSPPRGVLVGAAILENCEGKPGKVEYHIRGARRFRRPVPIVNRGPVRWFSLKVTRALESQLRAVGMWQEATEANRGT